MSSAPKKRTLKELVNTDDPAWPLVQDWIKGAKNHVEVISRKDEASGGDTLVELQVTTRSPMGALAYETGGLLIDHGFIRVLGSATDRMPSITSFNKDISIPKDASDTSQSTFLVVAFDAVGGVFAINAGGLSQKGIGDLFYFAQDSLNWDHLNMGYSEMLQWLMYDELESFYRGFRWSSWKQDVSTLPLTKAFNFYPPQWSKEFEIEKSSRKAVPIHELISMGTSLRDALSTSNSSNIQDLKMKIQVAP